MPSDAADFSGDDPREPGPGHWIAKERLGPGAAPGWWLAAAIGLALLVATALIALADEPGYRLRAEQAYQESDGFLQGIHALLGTVGARILSGLAAGVATLSTAIIARRLLHVEWPALLAATLVAIDPAMLVHGRLATPVAPASAAALVALALFMGRRPRTHWWASGLLTLACFLEPVHLWWSLPLTAMALVRGHIYAAPRHALVAGLQGLAIPLLGALLGLVGSSSLHDGCYQVRGLPGLFQMQGVDLGGFVATPNPITWFGGLVALLFLGTWALSQVLGQFRLQRLPGRVQIRLPDALRRIHGRVLWLVALAVFAPTPILWLPLFATALAAGTHELSRDARAFGVVVGLVLIVFAVIATVQVANVLSLDLVDPALPWTERVSC